MPRARSPPEALQKPSRTLPRTRNTPLAGEKVFNVTRMKYMFRRAESFNQPLNWNVSNVTNMNKMFHLASSFNQPLNWNVSNVTDMSDLFGEATSFNQPLTSPGGGSWNVSNVTNMNSMFSGADLFNQPLNDWNVSNVTNMQFMFFYAWSFNQPLDKWNLLSRSYAMLSMVTYAMFTQARSLNQPLSWDLFKITQDDLITR